MPQQHELNIDQQLQLAREIAHLVRARLPLEKALIELSGGQSRNLAHAAQLLSARLSQGQSLTTSIANGKRVSTRMLAAAIEIGQAANQLPAALESWVEYHIHRRQSRQRLRTALVYPALLTVIAVLSLAFTAWILVPQYDQAFALLTDGRPDWLNTVRWIQQHLWLFTITFFICVGAPPAIWWLRRNSFDKYGAPRDPSTRYFLHAHAARLSTIAVTTGNSLADTADCLLLACGDNQRSTPAHQPVLLQAPATFALLGRETALTLASLDARIITPQQCEELLTLIAEQIERRADAQTQRDVRWFPMLVALCVGLGVAVAYVGLIYLPWVTLFYEIAQPLGS